MLDRQHFDPFSARLIFAVVAELLDFREGAADAGLIDHQESDELRYVVASASQASDPPRWIRPLANM